jgi:hypothetical protein
MYKLYNVGDKTEPCGNPAGIYLDIDISPSIETLNSHCKRNALINLITWVENSNLDNLYSKPWHHVVSKAFAISMNTAAIHVIVKM